MNEAERTLCIKLIFQRFEAVKQTERNVCGVLSEHIGKRTGADASRRSRRRAAGRQNSSTIESPQQPQ